MVANPLVKFAWSPTAAQLEAANVVRLARALGCEDYTVPPPRLGRGARPLLARRRRRSRARAHAPLGPRARRLARDRVDDLVRGSAAERRDRLPPRLGGADARRSGGRLPGRGRRPARVDLRRALARDGPDRGGAAGARRRGRATASRSTCRCRRRRPSPRTPARTSAPSRCRSSPASPRRRSCSGCRTPGRRS